VVDSKLEKALDITTTMMSTRDIEGLIKKIVDIIIEDFGYQGCDAFLLDKERDIYILRQTKGFSAEMEQNISRLTITKEILKQNLSTCQKLGRFTYLDKVSGDVDISRYFSLLHPEKAAQPRKNPDDWHELDVLYIVFEDAQGKIAGFLEPDGPGNGKLPDDSLVTNMDIFAGLASIAVANAELVTVLDQTVNQFKILLDATAVLQEPLDLQRTLEDIAESLNKVVPFEEISIYLVDWEKNLMTPIYATGTYAAEVLADIGPISGLAGEVARTGKVDIVEDSLADQRVEDIPGIEEEETRQTIMCIPLKSKAGEVEGVLELYRDRSRKFTEAEWAVAEPFATHAAVALENARLREELKNNFETAQKAFDEMKALDQAKDNLVNTISHELRTPLTTILGYLEMTNEGLYGDVTPKMKEKIALMISSVNRINALVSKMVEMSRLAENTLVLDTESVNLAMVTKEVVKDLEHDIKAKDHTVSVLFGNDLPTVQADRMRIHDVVHTLLSNAIKYTNPGGKIVIGSDILGGKVHLWVKDNGAGISDEARPRIFDRFFVAGSGLVREDGRVGIGLYVAREVVRRHGGDMWFESKKNIGSTFHFTLPLKKA
jgi:signal transduction histidine kinase